MYEIGRLCVKIAGRDARKKCIIVDILDNTFVMIDGQTRRKKCNIKHLEPLDKVLKIKKGASHSEIVDALKKENIEVTETKPKQRTEKPKKAVASKTAAADEAEAKAETPKPAQKKDKLKKEPEKKKAAKDKKKNN